MYTVTTQTRGILTFDQLPEDTYFGSGFQSPDDKDKAFWFGHDNGTCLIPFKDKNDQFVYKAVKIHTSQGDVFVSKNDVLTNDQLQALYWHCLNTDGASKLTMLTTSQQEQLLAYAMSRAEEYSSTHSMRYAIMRDVIKSLYKGLCVLLICLLSLSGNAQNAKIGKDGNYYATSASKSTEQAKNTGKTFTDSKGVSYPVMISSKGKLFIIRTSKKTGKEYKQYLKL